jgi:hypothetical protein
MTLIECSASRLQTDQAHMRLLLIEFGREEAQNKAVVVILDRGHARPEWLHGF